MRQFHRINLPSLAVALLSSAATFLSDHLADHHLSLDETIELFLQLVIVLLAFLSRPQRRRRRRQHIETDNDDVS